MIDTPTHTDSDTVDPREIRAVRRLAALKRLSEIGMALAEILGRRVEAAVRAGEAIDMGAAALEYSRLSRAVRQTLALEARLDLDGAAVVERVRGERATGREDAARARAERIKFTVGRPKGTARPH